MSDYNFAATDDLIDLGGTAAKYEANIAALTILKELEAEGRDIATAHEQSLLARYTGWGDSTLIKRAFPNGTHAAALPSEELAAITTPEEQRALRSSSINAHYTSVSVIRAIYQGLLHLGLDHAVSNRFLRVLEPAAGVGHFFGAMPDELKRKAQFAAVELDPLSARITKLLYGSAQVYAEGFESANLPPDWFDLVISNVPFGNYKVCDTTVRDHFLRASIHDYFFTKALRVARSGGIIAFITSRFTLDKQDTRVRRFIAQHAELLAAVRLPNNAFTANAGTQVVTDILILRKRSIPLSPEEAKGERWTETVEYTVTDDRGTPVAVTLNRIFAEDETLMLGRACIGQHGLYGRNEFTVAAAEEKDLKDELTKTLRRILPANLLALQASDDEVPKVTPAQPKREPDSLEIAAQTEFAGISEARASLEQARAGHLLEIFRAAKEVIRIQVDNESDESLQTAQDALNRIYDRFRIRYGYINSKQNLAAFNEQNSILAFLRALEEPVTSSAGFRKAPLFTTRTIRPLRNTSRPESAAEALLLALNETGRADLEAVALACGKSLEEVRESLRGLIFQTPSGEWLTRDEYLSGNVRARLREAEAAARLDAGFQENVEALLAAQPTLLGAGEITARLGAAWIPEEVIETFARSLVPSYRGKIRYLAPTAQWVVEPPGWDAAASVEATQTWGTNRVHALDVLDDALNLRRTVVFDQIDDKTRVINQTETVAAQAKFADMKERFLEWVWKDAMRERELCRLYNEQFNVMRERRYDGSHLTLPGASTNIELRPAQKDAVWRILQSKSTLVAHAVGAGKAQPLTAKILTPTGWTTMGQIQNGDKVIAGDGTVTKVIGIYPQGVKDIYRVNFSDKSSTECCDEHLWKTLTCRERDLNIRRKSPKRTGEIRSLNEIRHTLLARRGIRNHSIPIVNEVTFRSHQVELDPYLLGVILGDGCISQKEVLITCNDEEVIDNCRSALPSGVYIRPLPLPVSKAKSYRIVRQKAGYSNPVAQELKRLGLRGKLSFEKFIPDNYKFNSSEVRLALLQGLMDTDGTVNRRGTSVYFNTSSQRLAEDVQFLVRSLGGVTRIKTKTPSYQHKGERRVGRLHYSVCICLPAHINPFRLSRKANLIVPKSKYKPARYIVGVDYVGLKEAQCIAVEHPEHLYVTDDFIVTHNTLTAIAAAMELRRLGIARKSMIVVPKHVAPQWAAEAQRLYPNLRLLTTDAKDFTKQARGETMSRIATSDWDLIVIPHPSFKLLPVKEETANHFIILEMERLRNYIAELAEDDERGNRRSIKQMEKTLKRFEAKLKTAEAEIRRDSTDTITFEEMGVEALFVDEFHNYKNLYFSTKMSRIAGLSNTESQQAFDMFIKSQWLLGQGGRFVGLTGTPISNTLCEGYVMMRYFQLDLLRELGLDHFDSWAQSFGETVTGVEMRPDGSGFRVNTRFAKFVNLAELARLQRLCWDVRTPEQLNLPRPALAGGCPITVAVEASPELEDYVGELSRRSERVSNRGVDPSQDNMLKITSDGRKAALDMRLVRPELDELPFNKIDAVVERVGRIYKRTHANRGAQILFCDLSTPKSSGSSRYDSAPEKSNHLSDEDVPLAA